MVHAFDILSLLGRAGGVPAERAGLGLVPSTRGLTASGMPLSARTRDGSHPGGKGDRSGSSSRDVGHARAGERRARAVLADSLRSATIASAAYVVHAFGTTGSFRRYISGGVSLIVKVTVLAIPSLHARRAPVWRCADVGAGD